MYQELSSVFLHILHNTPANNWMLITGSQFFLGESIETSEVLHPHGWRVVSAISSSAFQKLVQHTNQQKVGATNLTVGFFPAEIL